MALGNKEAKNVYGNSILLGGQPERIVPSGVV